jgi:poly(3-hydroxyoctanoate) depolymerase
MCHRRLSTLSNPRRYRDPNHLIRIAPKIYGGVIRKQPKLAHKYLGVSQSTSTSGYFGQLFALVGWVSIFWLHRLRQPTLVLAGRDDPIARPANARLLAACIPGARLQLVDDGHLFLGSGLSSGVRIIAATHPRQVPSADRSTGA